MGTTRAKMGRIPGIGVIPLFQTLNTMEWGGVLRLRSGTQIGAIWWVKGQIVHAVHYEGKIQTDGMPALDSIAAWTEGTYLLEAEVLPPARSIRDDMPEVLKWMESRRPAAFGYDKADETDRSLEGLLDELRRRVPGLESLSISRGKVLEMTTTRDEVEKQWLNNQLQAYMADDEAVPDTLFIQQQDHTLLIVKHGQIAAVLSAQAATAPEALFWAGNEAQKRMPVFK